MENPLKKATPFLKFHMVLVSLFMTTFLFGILMDRFNPLRTFHPFLGMSILVILPLYYLLSPKKKAILAMIKSNFKKAKNPAMTIARVSTVLFMLQLLIMILTGMAMYFKLYPNFDVYMVLNRIHTSATILFPLLVVVHAGSRLYLKKVK